MTLSVKSESLSHKPSRRLRQTFSLLDLSSLSISSVAPAFSISATTGVMVGYSGVYSILGILLLALPFLISSYTFRVLNRHFPHAGASYHWSRRVFGPRVARFQGWILMLAYFSSIPPILVPAAQYTLALIDPSATPSSWLEFLVGSFWMAFAIIPLLQGARPTARITQIFFVIEIIFLAVFAVFGILAFPHVHVPVGGYGFHPGGILLTMIVASTIMDGWEIDSYASEESTQPDRDPGLGGIIGAIFALVIYLIFVPLILFETPRHLLANSTVPMVLWAQRLQPFMPSHASIWILIPILASTAGSLWLTAYILIRGVFAMGRDGMIAKSFGKLNQRGIPAFATWVIFITAWAVMTLQLFVSSLSVFFNIVLTASGFFLIFEFALDNITSLVFLWRMHNRGDIHQSRDQRHTHRWMLVGSGFTAIYLIGLLISFIALSSRTISPWVDPTVALLLALGLIYALSSRTKTEEVHVFEYTTAEESTDVVTGS